MTPLFLYFPETVEIMPLVFGLLWVFSVYLSGWISFPFHMKTLFHEFHVLYSSFHTDGIDNRRELVRYQRTVCCTLFIFPHETY